MPRIFSVEFEATAVTAQVDFFEITPADDKPVSILGLFLSQSSDVGDAQDEILRYRIIRGHATSGSGGSAPTPRPVESSATAAAGFTAETLNTTIASAGTGVNLVSDCFNVRVGCQVWFPQGAQPGASQTDTLLVVRLMAAPADSVTMSGTLILAEV